MQVAKLGDRLAVVLPDAVAKSFGLKEGGEVDVEIRSAKALTAQQPDAREREEALERLRDTRLSLESESEGQQRREAALEVLDELSRPFPEGFKFDRQEANAR